jgi:uncharacterized membrane protein YfcA
VTKAPHSFGLGDYRAGVIEPELIAFGVVVILAYAIQSALGLGGMVVCVTLGALFLPVPRVLALAVPLSVAQTAYVCIRHRDAIDWKLLLLRILPLMALGAVLGLWLGARFDPARLRTFLGVVVLGLALRELWVRLRGRAPARPLAQPAEHAVMLAAGVVHGLFATGGPPLVYALARRRLDKRVFRSTISAVWFTLNLALALQYTWAGRYDRATALDLIRLAPTIPVGVILGEVLHQRVDEQRFQTLLYATLAVAALALLVR